MKKTLNLTVAFVLMLATVFVFCAFFAHSALPNATERDGLETISLTSEEEGKLSLINASGKSDYVIVYSIDENPHDITLAEKVQLIFIQKGIATVRVKSEALQKPAAASEILLGKTDRAESVQLLSDLEDQCKNADDVAWGYAVIGKKVVFTATDEAAFKYAMDDFYNLLVECDLTLESDLYYTVCMSAEEFETAVAEKSEQERLGMVEELRSMNAQFSDSQFNVDTYTPGIFYKPMVGADGHIQIFSSKPWAYPTAGVHPRYLINEGNLDEIRALLQLGEDPDSDYHVMAKTFWRLADTNMKDVHYGEFQEAGQSKYRYDETTLAVIEAKALAYLLTGNDLYAYEAIVGIKNAILSLYFTAELHGDVYHGPSHVMIVTAAVYDWCYDVLSETDKWHLIWGTAQILGPQMEDGMRYPPNNCNAVNGHGTGPQVLRDWMSVSSVFYDEAPDWWEFVAGRYFGEYLPVGNLQFQNGWVSQGTACYAPIKIYVHAWAALVVKSATGENFLIDDAGKTMYYLISHIMPNYNELGPEYQYYFSTGDYSGRPSGTRAEFAEYFLIAALYNDPVIYAHAKDITANHTRFDYTYLFTMTPTLQLCLSSSVDYNDEDAREGVDTIQYFADPAGQITARTSWDDPDAVAVMLRLGNLTMSNHEGASHGTFQIYYKGLLAGSTGSYGQYGSPRHYYYHQATISQNGLLVFNPALASANPNASARMYYYSGSQLAKNVSGDSAEAWYASGRMADTIGADYGYDADGNAKYAYLGGDLSQAYDSSTVEYIARHMLTIFTGDEQFPAIFLTYDKIVSKDPTFTKTWLLHTYIEPTIDIDELTAVSVHGDGKLLVKSLYGAKAIVKIGGEGKAYWINGYFADPNNKGSWDERTQSFTDPANIGSWVEGKNPSDPLQEGDGYQSIWGRIELRTDGEKDTSLLTLIAVTDRSNENDIAYTKFADELVYGVKVGNSIATFVNNKDRQAKEFSFTTEGKGLYEYYIANIEAGTWQIFVDGVSVAYSYADEGGAMLTFTAPTGVITVKPCADVIGGNGGRIQYDAGAPLPADTPYVYNNETATPLPTGLVREPDRFLGWYTSPNFEPETKITEIPAGTTGTVRVYAKWARNYLTEDYSTTVVDLQNTLKVINKITYQTEGKSGASFKTKYDEANNRNYLEWICGENDPLFSYSNESTNFANSLTDENKCVSFTFSFMREKGKPPIAADCRMIAKKDVNGKSISSTATYLYWIDQDGTVYTTDGGVLCTLEEGVITEIRVVVDFKKGEMRYFDEDFNLIETDNWTAPKTTGAANTEEFLKCLTQYLWYIRGTSAKDKPNAALRFYGVRVQESDEFTGNAKPQTKGIKYNTDGATLPEDAPKKFSSDGLPTILPADMEKPGYKFDGWYTTPDFREGTRTTYAPAGASGLYEVWAKWSKLFLDEDWTDKDIDFGTVDKTIGGINYSGKGGSAYKTVTEGGKTYLVWTRGSADPAFTYINESSNVSTMTDSSISYTVTIGKNGAAALPNMEFRLIGKKSVSGGSANSDIYLAHLIDGVLTLGDKQTSVLANLNEIDTYTVRIVIDFETGMLEAYDEAGVKVAQEALPAIPSSTEAGTYLEWRKCFRNYLFYTRLIGGEADTSVRFYKLQVEEGNAFVEDKVDTSGLTYIKYQTNDGLLDDDATVKYDPSADTPLSIPYKDGYAFGGWYTTPTFDSETLTTCVPLGYEGLYQVWAKWIDVSIRYETNGGTLPADAPTEYDITTDTPLPTDVTKNGYLFAGWYYDEACAGERVEYIPRGTENTIKIYAKWIFVPFAEDWDEKDFVHSGKLEQTRDGFYYSTKAGVSFETVEDEKGGKYLRFRSTNYDGLLGASNDGAYQFPEFKETAVSFMFDYGRDGDLPLATNYVALNTANGAQGIKWLITIDGATGEAKFDETGDVIAVIGEDMVTFRITVDFAAATVTAYDEDHNVIASAPLGTLPKQAGVSTWAEWQKVAKGYYLYHQLTKPKGFTKGDGKFFGARYDNFVAVDGRAFI